MTKTKTKNKAPVPAGATRRTAATLPIANLTGAAWNTHNLAKGEDEGFQGLIASMKANGLIQRVAVRPSAARPSALRGATPQGTTALPPESEGTTAPQSEGEIYEIIDGHRRVEAARALGWTEVPCEIIEGLTDEEAQAMTLTANIQRLDNDPLLEAACIERLAKAGKTHEQIAAILGKTARYVARRARICNLTPEWRGWFGRQEGVTADLMETVAAHEKTLQTEVFMAFICNDDGTVDEDIEISEDQIIHAFVRRLRRIDGDTPFDTTLCATCHYNTATHGWLFAPETDEESKGRCENATCFIKRWNAATDAQIRDLRKRKVKVYEAKELYRIPNYWTASAHKDAKHTEPWVYMEGGLEKLIWVERGATPAHPEDAKTEAEKKAERELKARQKAWRTNRASAYEKLRTAVDVDVYKVRKVTAALIKSERFLKAVEEEISDKFLVTSVSDYDAQTYLEALDEALLKELGVELTEDERKALSEADEEAGE